MISAVFLTIGTGDFNTVVNFYQQWLQQAPRPFQPDHYAEFRLPGLKLGIFAPQASHQGEFNQSAGSGFSLCCEVDDLEAVIADLARIGYPVSAGIQTSSHGREIYAYDPAGNRLILHQGLKT